MINTVITLRIEPYYQRFIRNHFSCNRPFFEFPRDHDFNNLISFCMKPLDSSSDIPDYDEETFMVDIPLQIHQSKGVYYLPEKIQVLFKQRVEKFYQMHFHVDMAKLHSDGYKMHEAITILTYRYGLPDDKTTFERMKKDFYRWRQKRYNMNRGKKNQKKMLSEVA